MSVEALPPRLVGQKPRERAFLDAMAGGRMPHAWLLAGPRGVGKASFAHLASAALLSDAPPSDRLSLDPGDPVHAAIASGNEPRLVPLTRMPGTSGTLRTQIIVDDVRALLDRFSLAETEGRWRAVIVDAAEEMNRSAANALLKFLEEPPPRTVIFLVSHAPGTLLPTLVSRCRRLAFPPLEDGALAEACALVGATPDAPILAAARGSVGEALSLAAGSGAALQEALAKVLAPLPARIDRPALHALADLAAGKGEEDAFRAAGQQLADAAARLAVAATGAAEAPEGMAHLAGAAAPLAWAEAASDIEAALRRTAGLNLDRRQALLDMVARLERAAARP